MWCNPKFNLLLIATIFVAIQKSSAIIYSNSTMLTSFPDDSFFGMPVYFKSNLPRKSIYTKQRMQEHIQRILKPLTPYILSEDVKLYAQRRGDLYGSHGSHGSHGTESIVQVEQYDLPYIAAAQIGPYTFSCRQNNGELVIHNPHLHEHDRIRAIPSFTEFQLHPKPGIWWWVQCVTFETGGAGMGISGVQKPGGDSGIDPNALKSLVG